MQRVVIVGGGISGLALAYRLRQRNPDWQVLILESHSRPGGKIWTERFEGFLVEYGPNGFLDTKPSTQQLAVDLGLTSELVAGSEAARRHRYLFIDQRLQVLPSGPIGLLTSRLFSWRGKWGILRELFRRGRSPSYDESVADFFRRRLGPEAARVLGDALVTGIHGGDPELLSLASAFPRAAEMEARYGSVIRGFLRSAKERRQRARQQGLEPPMTGRLWSFRGGLRRLVEALVAHLPDAVQLGVCVRRIRPSDSGWTVLGEGRDSWTADAVVLACPAYQSAEIVSDIDLALAEELRSIAYNRIVVVALGYDKQHVSRSDQGFGFIAPQNTRRDILGVQWCSTIYPDRAPPGYVLWRALCGGWNRPEMVDWDDDRLIQAVRQELRLSMAIDATPVFSQIIRWDRAIPQYHVGHRDRLLRIADRMTQYPGLYLAGNAYHGVAINDCTEHAEQLADQLTKDLLYSRS
jgi:oxygen-dependent protoporphyrinogen oxidase